MNKIPLPQWPALEPGQAEQYRAFRLAQIVPFERLAAVAGAASIVLFIWWDAQVSDEALPETLYIRLGLAAVLLLLLGITYTPLARHHRFTQLLSTIVVVGGFSWVLSRLPNGFAVGLAGLALSIALLPLLAATFWSMVALCAVAVLIPNLFLAGTYASRFTFINLNLWLALAVALALSFWAMFELVNRRLFLAERDLSEERERADRLLRNILPEAIVERLKTSSASVAERYEAVTVLFADIVGFTSYARANEAGAVVDLLNELFSRFDDLVEAAGVEKIKTIGDGYMVAGGVPIPRPDHARAVADLALDMVTSTAEFGRTFDVDWDIRIGVHTGSVVAGVIGKRKFAYDLWGDAVNVASRLESSGEAGRIQMSETTADLLPAGYKLVPRGTIMLKNRGEVTTFFLVSRHDSGEPRERTPAVST